MESKTFLVRNFSHSRKKKKKFLLVGGGCSARLRAPLILSAASEDGNGDSGSAAVPSDTGRQGQANNRKYRLGRGGRKNTSNEDDECWADWDSHFLPPSAICSDYIRRNDVWNIYTLKLHSSLLRCWHSRSGPVLLAQHLLHYHHRLGSLLLIQLFPFGMYHVCNLAMAPPLPESLLWIWQKDSLSNQTSKFYRKGLPPNGSHGLFTT